MAKNSITFEQLKSYFEAPNPLQGSDPSAKKTQALKKQRLKYATHALELLDQGKLRVWTMVNSEDVGTLHVWVKSAILAYFSIKAPEAQRAGCFEFYDKLKPKIRRRLNGVRVVPGAIARWGSFVESGAVLMPCFINTGAYIGSGSMIDTWATVGSCAQIGKNCHLSGGVGIGGVLEPAQATPVIIEDGVFVGSRAILVEGVRVGTQAVIGAGVVITASTKIVDLRGSTPVITKGYVPQRAVVIQGSMPKDFPAGTFGVPCAMIIGERSAATDTKTSLNDALRNFAVPV